MPAIPLRIFVHGLIALVPTTDPTGVNHMMALLVDGRTPMQEQCMREPHEPQLRFFVKETADCLAVAGCKSVGNQCTCRHSTTNGPDPLGGKLISIEILPTPVVALDKPKGGLPDHALPLDNIEAGSFSYVANLSQVPFGLEVDPIYLVQNPSPAARTHLIARMEIPFKDLTACALAMRGDGGEENVHSMSFRQLHAPSQSGEVSYALAQKVVAEVMVPDAESDGQIVKLHIQDFDGTHDQSFTLKPSLDAYRVDVGNDPEKSLSIDDPCDDGVARHFMQFYGIALNPPPEQLIPHIKTTQFTNAASLQPKICKDPIFGLDNHPICPMVSFTQ